MSTRHFALLSALLLAACSSSEPKEDEGSSDWRDPTNPIVKVRLQSRIDNIKYQHGPTLVANLERIAAYGPTAVPACIEGLQSEDAMTRMGCSYALGRIGDTTAIPALEGVLEDEVPYVRYEAASQLGTLGSRAGYPVLVQGLSDERIEYRYKCIEALRELTGHTFDYSHNADAERRTVAVGKWQVWLERLQAEDF